jgi:hypothetical protein
VSDSVWAVTAKHHKHLRSLLLTAQLDRKLKMKVSVHLLSMCAISSWLVGCAHMERREERRERKLSSVS